MNFLLLFIIIFFILSVLIGSCLEIFVWRKERMKQRVTYVKPKQVKWFEVCQEAKINFICFEKLRL